MFNVVTGTARGRPSRRVAFLLLSLGAHVLVLGSLVGASLWSVGESPEPPIPIVFFSGPSAPPPPVGTVDGRDAPQKPSRPHSPKPELSAPAVISDSIPVSEDPSPISTPGFDGGISIGPKGDPNGVKDGIGDVPAGTSGNQPVTLATPGVVGPVLLRQIAPEYPELARRLRQQGIVVVSAVIETDGSVEEMRIVHSAFPLLEEPALRAIREWRYRPGTLSGRAVRVLLNVQIDFSLR